MAGEPKEGARYFVLDYAHDIYARMALAMYLTACRATKPALADDLERELAQYMGQDEGWSFVALDPEETVLDHRSGGTRQLLQRHPAASSLGFSSFLGLGFILGWLAGAVTVVGLYLWR